MPDTLAVPILTQLALPELTYGANYLVEFDSNSLWYETSLTIAAQALRKGVRTDYHTFMHLPREVERALSGFGLDLENLAKDGTFRMMDNYTATTGTVDLDEITRQTKSQEAMGGVPSLASMLLSVDLKDWAATEISEIKGGFRGTDRKRLHLDDNTTVLVQYNDEKSFIDHWRTHEIPWSRGTEVATIHSAVTGVYSEAFYRQYESLCDGIIDFRSRDENGIIQQYARIRSVRAKPHDSRWRRLELQPNGTVKVDQAIPKLPELGIGGWLKGPRR